MSISAGTRLADKYELIRQLGEGGMGVVWLAKHCDLGTEVAIKVLRASVLNDKEAVLRFDREARAAASLRGPHITRTLDVGRHTDGSPYMVMEFLEGRDLGQEISAVGPLPIAQAVSFVLQACEGMSEAHARGVVHRDLKPENLFLVESHGRREVKILDFGISKFQADGDLRVTQTQTSFGTPLYMSPEQVRSTKNVDHRTDLWSLGVILYEALTAELPFMGETPTAVAVAVTVDAYQPLLTRRPDAPSGLEEVIARALSKDPSKRYQTADELADALEPFCNVVPSASPSRPLQSTPHVAVTNTMRVSSVDVPAARPASRKSGFLLAGLVIGGAVMLVGSLLVIHQRSAANNVSETAPATAKVEPGASAPREASTSASASNASPDVHPVEVPASSTDVPRVTPGASVAASAAPVKDAAKPAHSASKPHADPPAHVELPQDSNPKPKPSERNPQFL